MQTIIMTVGTSLRTNRDDDLPLEAKRPWAGKRVPETQTLIDDREQALAWMKKTYLELISAETNTFWRLDPRPDDEIILLHSETVSGLECAEVLKLFLEKVFEQTQVRLIPIPGINYELDESGSTLERMAELLKKLIQQAKGSTTLAATGGFKAQTMVMAIVGNSCGVSVCYVHELYRALIYLPYFPPNLGGSATFVQPGLPIRPALLPESTKPRDQVVTISDKEHHRPKVWKKVKKMLEEIPWIEYVRFDDNAFNAPKNGVKRANRSTKDGCHIFWIHLYESEDTKMAVSVETTGFTPEHSEQAAAELRQRLSKLIS